VFEQKWNDRPGDDAFRGAESSTPSPVQKMNIWTRQVRTPAMHWQLENDMAYARATAVCKWGLFYPATPARFHEAEGQKLCSKCLGDFGYVDGIAAAERTDTPAGDVSGAKSQLRAAFEMKRGRPG